MSFRKLRELLSKEPSFGVFSSICTLLESWEGADISLAIEYCQQHMEDWKGHFAFASDIDWTASVPVWWPLVRCYEETCLQSTPAIWFEKGFLQEVKQLNIIFQEMDEEDAYSFLRCFRHFEQLKELTLSGCNSLIDLKPLRYCRSLTTLRLQSCKHLQRIDTLICLDNLEKLVLSDCESLTSLKPLRKLKSLYSFDFNGAFTKKDEEVVSSLSQLRRLSLGWKTSLHNSGTLRHLTSLRDLCFHQCEDFENFRPLKNLKELVHLSVHGIYSLQNIDGIENLNKLENLSLKSCESLICIDGIESLKKLKTLDLSLCDQLASITPLRDTENLESLDLSYCEGLLEINAIKDLQKLSNLDLSHCSNLPFSRTLNSMRSRKEVVSFQQEIALQEANNNPSEKEKEHVIYRAT